MSNNEQAVKYFNGSMTLDNVDACKSVLQSLGAPQEEANIQALQALVKILGQISNDAYELMLRKMANKRLAMFECKCPCGQTYQVSLNKGDFPTPQHVV